MYQVSKLPKFSTMIHVGPGIRVLIRLQLIRTGSILLHAAGFSIVNHASACDGHTFRKFWIFHGFCGPRFYR